VSHAAYAGMIAGLVLFAIVAVLVLEWLLPDRTPSETRAAPHLVTDWPDWDFPSKDTSRAA
jgi:hypothetical protein